mmetsp:Transcript_11978/g.17812  ORF Transcript_11978/g.17812 Transcript_11978/m.17812 type:complete len:542 (+) Transcript_11978:485-2110(+)
MKRSLKVVSTRLLTRNVYVPQQIRTYSNSSTQDYKKNIDKLYDWSQREKQKIREEDQEVMEKRKSEQEKIEKRKKTRELIASHSAKIKEERQKKKNIHVQDKRDLSIKKLEHENRSISKIQERFLSKKKSEDKLREINDIEKRFRSKTKDDGFLQTMARKFRKGGVDSQQAVLVLKEKIKQLYDVNKEEPSTELQQQIWQYETKLAHYLHSLRAYKPALILYRKQAMTSYDHAICEAECLKNLGQYKEAMRSLKSSFVIFKKPYQQCAFYEARGYVFMKYAFSLNLKNQFEHKKFHELHEKAIKSFRLAMKADSSRDGITLSIAIGKAYQAMGKLEKALEQYNHVLEQHDEHRSTLLLRIDANMKLKRYEAAMTDIVVFLYLCDDPIENWVDEKRGPDFNPDKVILDLLAKKIYITIYHGDDYQLALDDANELLEHLESIPTYKKHLALTYGLRGRTLLRMGDLPRAEADLDRAIELSEGRLYDAFNDRADLYRQMDRLEEAQYDQKAFQHFQRKDIIGKVNESAQASKKSDASFTDLLEA